MGADLRDDDPILNVHPVPYAAMAWFLTHTPEGVFLGNPRVHFQHYADRMNEPRRELRRARAWACWAITRRLRPSLPADPKHEVIEPSKTEIAARLVSLGLKHENQIWQDVLDACIPKRTGLKTYGNLNRNDA
jgi:hypothetical protein